MQKVALPPASSQLSLNYIDLILVLWLIYGLYRGRKRGMSQELLPMIQWLAIVVAAGLFYKPFSKVILQNAHFELLWSNVLAYVLIGFGVHLVYLWIKYAIGDKLVGSDLFGRGEYYMGMMAGMVRFACMWVALCALLNSRVITKAEMAKTEKAQSEAFSDIRFPTYGSIQHAILFESVSGKFIETKLDSFMIASVAPKAEQKGETLAHRKERLIDEVIGGPKK
jgi:uncharacterized membrane protein required for colicin V production